MDAFDINSFVLAYSQPEAYDVAFLDCSRQQADVNADGVVDADDVAAFVERLLAP